MRGLLLSIMIQFCCLVSALDNRTVYGSFHVVIKNLDTSEQLEDLGWGNLVTRVDVHTEGKDIINVRFSENNEYRIIVVKKERKVNSNNNDIVYDIIDGACMTEDYKGVVGSIRIIDSFDMSKNRDVPVMFSTIIQSSKYVFEYNSILKLDMIG